ncbi:MAG TPA: outer membrane beta-barrel protein [Candidatus Eisenbacteria bacterium]|nr:outer membrane beta-barrel protein [Candidatus Eisenbacteria bacterium]
MEETRELKVRNASAEVYREGLAVTTGRRFVEPGHVVYETVPMQVLQTRTLKEEWLMRALLITALLIAALPAAAMAQDVPFMKGTLEFAPTGGASIPFGDFNTMAEPGYNIGATGAFYLMPNLAVGGNIVWNSYSADADPDNTTISIWEFTGTAKYLFMPGTVTPYAKGAAGIFMTKVSIDDPVMGNVSDSASDMGVGGGVGIQARIPKSRFGVFGETMANVAFTPETSTTYYTVRLGLNIYNGGPTGN